MPKWTIKVEFRKNIVIKETHEEISFETLKEVGLCISCLSEAVKKIEIIKTEDLKNVKR